jgi:A/G-specific adenine glycosylase
MQHSTKDRVARSRKQPFRSPHQAAPAAIEPHIRSSTIRTIQNRLRAWYLLNARDLPWRHTRDPYCIWVSEVMLQQTQVSTVLPYYTRFINRFPTIASLAAASSDEVLRYWQGLGYYRRAANLHRAAKYLVAEQSAHISRDVRALRQLPGVGRYIAAAIQSIAFGMPAAILEANSARVLSRLFAVRSPLGSSATARALWSLAEELVCHKSPAQHNQALMELGALVCTPARPQCGQCPVQRLCRAKQQGLTEELPVTMRRPDPVDVSDAAAIIWSKGRTLVVQRTQRERWGGLWELPRVSIEHGRDARQVLQGHVRAKLGLEIDIGPAVLTIKHSVTHHRITLTCYESRLVKGELELRDYDDSRWITPARLPNYPCSAPQRKAFDFVRRSACPAAAG